MATVDLPLARRRPTLAARHRTPLLATVPTLPLYAVWALFLATGGGDLAAQEAWARFAADHGASAYNLFWYGGMHTANYSLISPYLMAELGVRPVTVVSGLAAAWLGAVLVVRTGIARPLPPAVLLSLALWCNVASGRTTFALGTAFGLGACVALTGERPRYAVAMLCAALATTASPVAGLFLAVVGAGWLCVRDWRRAAAQMAPPALVVGATTLLFPFKGEQLMPMDRIWPPVVFSLALAVAGPRRWRVARWSACVYAAGTVVTYLVPSPIGTNVERLAELAAPAVLLAALLDVRGHARVKAAVLAVALVLSSAWLVQKTVDDLRVSTTVPTWAARTHGVVRELERLGADRTRVEVIPARNHREATALAPYVNMARGWNRQLDIERGRLFYDGTFSAATYRAWLDRWAVGLVVLPEGKPDGFAEQEAAFVRSGPVYLEPVWRDPHWHVYRVRNAVPLVSAPATVVRSDGARVTVRFTRAGTATLRVAYSPWLKPETAGGCLKVRPQRAGEFTELVAAAPGTYRIGSDWESSPSPRPSGAGCRAG
ncbi:hypothetical protein J3486_18030 [Streptomyces sp. VRA16 Mangrove soil]|nr:hypothetical protein [Streptomyces sp. VRA16 Mangrove soil]MBO1333132.1 hypothetical protein [Streptomyces sp. VRA16 Mangrove soil]